LDTARLDVCGLGLRDLDWVSAWFQVRFIIMVDAGRSSKWQFRT
jgi:hypothetical protein